MPTIPAIFKKSRRCTEALLVPCRPHRCDRIARRTVGNAGDEEVHKWWHRREQSRSGPPADPTRWPQQQVGTGGERSTGSGFAASGPDR